MRPALLGDERGRDYDVIYLGYNGGRADRAAEPHGLGSTMPSARSRTTSSPASARHPGLVSAPPSSRYDFDWIRLRGCRRSSPAATAIPIDDTDARLRRHLREPDLRRRRHQLLDPPDHSLRRRRPRGPVDRPQRHALNSLRSSKEQGQSNFINPGTMLLGLGADFDITPEFRLSGNVNHLWFHETAVLEALRKQRRSDSDIGWDLSAAAICRPYFTQNIVLRLSGALLVPGQGFRDLFWTN